MGMLSVIVIWRVPSGLQASGGNGDGARNCFIMSREKQTNEGLNVKDGCIGYNL